MGGVKWTFLGAFQRLFCLGSGGYPWVGRVVVEVGEEESWWTSLSFRSLILCQVIYRVTFELTFGHVCLLRYEWICDIEFIFRAPLSESLLLLLFLIKPCQRENIKGVNAVLLIEKPFVLFIIQSLSGTRLKPAPKAEYPSRKHIL